MSLSLAYLALASLAAFVSFWRDKRAAQGGGRRVSEARLLTLAALGGTPGAKLGQSLLIAAGVVGGVLWLRFAAF